MRFLLMVLTAVGALLIGAGGALGLGLPSTTTPNLGLPPATTPATTVPTPAGSVTVPSVSTAGRHLGRRAPTMASLAALSPAAAARRLRSRRRP